MGLKQLLDNATQKTVPFIITNQNISNLYMVTVPWKQLYIPSDKQFPPTFNTRDSFSLMETAYICDNYREKASLHPGRETLNFKS
jgi:hypothetical protein